MSLQPLGGLNRTAVGDLFSPDGYFDKPFLTHNGLDFLLSVVDSKVFIK